MDVLMTETNPKTVTFEMDILWVIHPGESPEKWLAEVCSRPLGVDSFEGLSQGIADGHSHR